MMLVVTLAMFSLAFHPTEADHGKLARSIVAASLQGEVIVADHNTEPTSLMPILVHSENFLFAKVPPHQPHLLLELLLEVVVCKHLLLPLHLLRNGAEI